MEKFNEFISNTFNPDNIMILLVIFLVLLAIVIICLIRSTVKENNKILTQQPKIEPKPETKENSIEHLEQIDEYEHEQEEKAIISYEELLKNASKLQVDYEDDEKYADLVIQKVALTEKEEKKEEQINIEIENKNFYSYEEEEEFLDTLKQFRANL